MSVSLLYGASCPLSYQSPGFLETDSRQIKFWENQERLTQVAKFEVHLKTVTVGVERRDHEEERDQEFSNELNALQHTSSRDQRITPTLDQPVPWIRRESAADPGRKCPGSTTPSNVLFSSRGDRAKRSRRGPPGTIQQLNVAVSRDMVRFSSSSRPSTGRCASDEGGFR